MTATLEVANVRPATGESPLLLTGITWETYGLLRRDLDEAGSRLYLTYDNGNLEIMPPLPVHERWKSFLGSFIDLLAVELDIPLATLGSTTFRRGDLQKGLEPDECYYVQHELAVRGKEVIDLAHDPPPDLAVEVDVTSRSIAREPIYAAMGVSEIWRFDLERLSFLKLSDSKQYVEVERSIAFPFLAAGEVERFLRMWPKLDETSIRRQFREWVRTSFGEGGKKV